MLTPFQQLPDDFKDFVTEHVGGKHQSDAFYTHCHREFFHEQWKMLLDKDFIHAYEHGLVIMCCDGIARRFYPRIFTYSADYPEKQVTFYVLANKANSVFVPEFSLHVYETSANVLVPVV